MYLSVIITLCINTSTRPGGSIFFRADQQRDAGGVKRCRVQRRSWRHPIHVIRQNLSSWYDNLCSFSPHIRSINQIAVLVSSIWHRAHLYDNVLACHRNYRSTTSFRQTDSAKPVSDLPRDGGAQGNAIGALRQSSLFRTKSISGRNKLQVRGGM